MSTIVLDAGKVNSYVLPSLSKSENTMYQAYSTSQLLRNSLPNSFNGRGMVNEITTQIYNLKKEINDIDTLIEKKIERAKAIESKGESRIGSIASKIGSIVGTISGAAIGSATGGVVGAVAGAVVGNQVGKTVGKTIYDTGAKIVSGFVSGVKKIGSAVVDGFKWVGSKVVSGVKTTAKWVKNTAKTVTSWIADKFESAKDWTCNALKSAGACISKTANAAWTWIKDAASIVWTHMKKIGASIVNGVLSLVKGLVKLIESIGDLVILLGAGIGTIGTAIWDTVKGIATGKWEWSATKGLWKGTKAVVAYDWTSKCIFDSLYNTGFGKWLDNNAYGWFKSDGMGCKILEGVGYVAGVVVISICTLGAGGIAITSSSIATTMAVAATAAGIGKYTEEEWNKNCLSISYGNQEIGIQIDYEKYSEIEKLQDGKSTTITQYFADENGNPIEMKFTITKIGDAYSITDNNGNQVGFNGVKESSTVKGLAVGTVKGVWEGVQYYVGGKIGAGQFTSLTSKFTSPVAKTLVRSGTRVGLDMLTGVAEVPFQSTVTMVSEGKTWNEAWNENGGWQAVKTQAGIAGLASFAGEAFSFKGSLRSDTMKNAIDFGDTEALDEMIKNTKSKQIMQTISILDDSQLDKIIKSGMFENLDNASKTTLVNSIDDKKIINILSDSSLGDTSLKQITNSLDESRIQRVLSDGNIMSTLRILSNLPETQFDNIIKNIDSISNQNKVFDFVKKMVNIYDEGSIAAQTKYKEFFKNFREHGIKHSTKVSEYAVKIAKNIDGVDLDEVAYAAFIHDFGMRGGITYVDENMAKEIANAGGPTNIEGKYIKIDSLEGLNIKQYNSKTQQFQIVDSKDYLDNLARKNHPLNSALAVLTDKDVLPDGVNKDVVALLAMSHSKSTSGIKHFSSSKEWIKAIDKLDTALKQYGDDIGKKFDFDADKLKEMINDPKKFKRLQDEALAIRDGDAMSDIVEKTAGNIKGTQMQDGTISVARTTEIRKDYNTPVLKPDEEYKLIKDEIYDEDGKFVRELQNEKEIIVKDANGVEIGKYTIGEEFSKKIHIGESNVEFNSSYVDGKYRATVTIKNANQTPNATFAAIEERIGEVNTYTNCDYRTFEIVLPKEAKGTELGKWYEETLEDLKYGIGEKKLKDSAQLAKHKDIITEQEYQKQLDFYKKLEIVYR